MLAGSLQPGHEISSNSGKRPLTVIALEADNAPAIVYNLEIAAEDGESTYSYFAGKLQAWVHNGQRGIGPSGKLKIHIKKYPSRKRSKDAARNKPGSCGVQLDASPKVGRRHFHSVGRGGNRLKDRVHHEF